MANSKQLAGLIGPTILVPTTSEGLNFRIWAVNIPAVTYLNGIILFVAGLSILRVHNLWTLSWPVLVTLSGWSALLLGLFRVFAPEAQQAGDTMVSYLGLAVLFAAGAILTFQGHRAE